MKRVRLRRAKRRRDAKLNIADKNKSDGFVIYIPINLNIEEHIKRHKPRVKLSTKKLLLFISLIYQAAANKKDNIKENGYVKLHSSLLKKLDNNYREYVEYLIATDVWRCDNEYKNKAFSKGYNFSETYFTLPQSVVIKNIRSNSYTKKVADDRKKNYVLAKKKYPILVKFFDHLYVDYDNAKAYLEKEFNRNIKKKSYYHCFATYIRSAVIVDNINSRQFALKVDDYGRLHSPVTRISKNLRRFLYYKHNKSDNKQFFSSIDLKNSQPYFLSLILTNSLIINNLYNKDLFDTSHYLINQFIYKSIYLKYNKSYYNTSTSTMFLNLSMNSILKQENQLDRIDLKEVLNDVNDYILFLKKGVIYELIIELLNTSKAFKRDYKEKYESNVKNDPLWNPPKKELHTLMRDISKLQMMKLLYSSNRSFADIKSEIKGYFPNLIYIIETIKSKKYSLFRKKKHAVLAALLQEIESFMLLHIICSKIHSIKPEMPIFTIHDSLLLPESDIELVKDSIELLLESLVGIKPHLHID